MKLSARMIATLTVAVLLMPVAFLNAQELVGPLDGAVVGSANLFQPPANPFAGAAQYPGAPRPSASYIDTPRIDLFVGYSYLRATPTLADGNRFVHLNGGETSIAFNLNRYLGLVADFAGYDDTQLRLTGPGANPNRVADSGGSAYLYLFGPRISFRNYSRVTPFVQALFGGVYASDVTLSGCTGAACTPLPAQNAFALTAGGGLDIRVSRHVSIRPVQAEYLMTRFADTVTNAGDMQNNIRLSAGLVFSFGGNAPLPPPPNRAPSAVCSTDNKTIYAGSGDVVLVRAQANDPDNDHLSYAWTANGGTLDGTGPEARWNSSGTVPGTYTIHLLVDDGKGGTGDCSADVEVAPRPNRAPVISCIADRDSVNASEVVLITATASDADNDSLTFSWSASSGKIVGSGSSVKLDTTGLASGRYTVTGSVSDGRGGTADCSVNIDIQSPTALELRLALHSIYFPTAKPTVKNPTEGLLASQKQILVSLASDFGQYLQSKPDAHLILEGHADPRASAEYNQALSERRVESTKRFLIDQGVPSGNIETKAFGDQHNLTDSEVRDAIERNDDLTPAERQKMLDNMTTIILASNRRVDVSLSTTGQRSIRKYPFNAADAVTLLNQDGTSRAKRTTVKQKVTPATE
ncbi:outer membrane protein OmpA-like peptidoglycan-associated protein/opacity protein-like surface antigen [Silvibacterium bohemicum]|uniref:Outer membrane protein OmpA-like peptidoglycan-associated protein/opacity protein-like surface antigen n=1 Tax=Silvibacterium bohemicum TaxID=1577686 RepID=A0A841K2R4_9BACT|nr:OmpA family protein [Silvibacterium bohemicum]MBB6147305.1 outer membrane protein OmpA-like peptidoglycan-associated protein/opacity protein-like surface antigen [Silvibacterium bohemicum]